MQIDVFHDTVCPWCRIGKANLKLALKEWQGEPVTITYRTFFLNADIPSEGYDFKPYMMAKGGGRIPLEQFFAGPRQAGERVGLRFDFEAIEKAPNSLLSHQLIALTPEPQREAMIDAVYAAYFEHGRDISDLEVLLQITQAQGLNVETMRHDLQANAKRDEILAEAEAAQQAGITGVPFFIFNRLFAFSGAQPPDVFLRALEQAGAIMPFQGQ